MIKKFYVKYVLLIQFEVFVTRCLNKETLDTCVPFTTLKPINTCALIAMSNMAWSELVNSIKPPIKCPFKTVLPSFYKKNKDKINNFGFLGPLYYNKRHIRCRKICLFPY